MDGKGHRDPDDVAADDAAARTLGFPYFSLLPPDVQLHVLLQRNISVKEMHKRCNLYAGLRALCENRSVWKTKFIERNVKQPGDRRDPSKHEQWADEPRVQEWDRDARSYHMRSGYVHLVADHIMRVARGWNHVWLVRRFQSGIVWKMSIVYQGILPSGVKAFYITATATVPLSGHAQEEFADWKSTIPQDLYRSVVKGSRTEDIFYTRDDQVVSFVAYLLENEFTYIEGSIKIVNACAICAEPATLQCAHCNDLYCSISCAQAE